eukprot:3504132-Amphidinium_carterae.1
MTLVDNTKAVAHRFRHSCSPSHTRSTTTPSIKGGTLCDDPLQCMELCFSTRQGNHVLSPCRTCHSVPPSMCIIPQNIHFSCLTAIFSRYDVNSPQIVDQSR